MLTGNEFQTLGAENRKARNPEDCDGGPKKVWTNNKDNELCWQWRNYKFCLMARICFI